MKNPHKEDFDEISDYEDKVEILETSSIWKHFNFKYSNNNEEPGYIAWVFGDQSTKSCSKF